MIDGIPIWLCHNFAPRSKNAVFLWHKKSTFRCFALRFNAQLLTTLSSATPYRDLNAEMTNNCDLSRLQRYNKILN
jgi:hypothetical protein